MKISRNFVYGLLLAIAGSHQPCALAKSGTSATPPSASVPGGGGTESPPPATKNPFVPPGTGETRNCPALARICENGKEGKMVDDGKKCTFVCPEDSVPPPGHRKCPAIAMPVCPNGVPARYKKGTCTVECPGTPEPAPGGQNVPGSMPAF